MTRALFRIPLVVLVALMLAGAAAADGMLFPTTDMPRQPFSVKYHRVTVTIDSQIAKTHVEQAFVNDSDQRLEGTYLFPVPEQAKIRDFAIYDGDNRISGELLAKDEAVRIYEGIVRKQRDPGLLEYIGRDTIRARVFPIPAHSERRFTVDYAEVIPREAGLCRYLYPLSTERFSARPLAEVSVSVRIRSQAPIKNIYSPSHEISIQRTSDREAEVGYEASQTKPATDFALYYGLSDDDIGLTLLSYKEKGDRGYWMLLASPKVPAKDEVVPKDVVFVLDRTGSMAGDKIEQAKAALRFCLDNLRPRDRFDVVAFNESATSVGDELLPADAAHLKKARGFIEDLAARGNTNIDEALQRALRLSAGSSRPRYIVFLTDGLPTAGVTNPDTILKHVAARNEGTVRFFIFGVGYDVNVHFLDKLSEENRGVSEYVRPNENIEAKVAELYGKVAAPVLTDVTLNVSGVQAAQVFPRAPLADLFSGSQAIMVGTYNGPGRATVVLSGKRASANGGERSQRYVLKADLPEHDTRYDFVPVLWASRKIGYLLDEVRLRNDPKLVEQIVALSKEFGIMTEFTAFLAVEPGMDADEASARARSSVESARKEVQGSWSVGQAQNAARLRGAAAPAAVGKGKGGYGGFKDDFGAAGPAGPAGAPTANSNQAFIDARGQVQAVGGVQNVGRQTFYQRGNAWVDQRVSPKTPTVRIQRLSEAHFQLARASAEARRYLALGNDVTFMMNGQAIVVGEAGKTSLSASELKAITGPSR